MQFDLQLFRICRIVLILIEEYSELFGGSFGLLNGDKKNSINRLFSLAVITGNLAAVNHFIELGEDVNSIDSDNKSLLMHAILAKHIEICKILLKAGADPFYADNNGTTVLHLAELSGNVYLSTLITSYIKIKTKSFNNVQNVLFDFGEESESGWEIEEKHSIPESDLNLLEKIKSDHYDLSSFIAVDSDETLDDLDIEFPEIFLRKKPKKTKINNSLKNQLREVLNFGFENGFLHKQDYLNEIKDQEILKSSELSGILEAAFSASGINVIDFDTLDPQVHNIATCTSLSQKFQIDEIFDFIEIELDGYRNPLAIFLNEAASYKLLTDEQVKKICTDINDAYTDLLGLLSSDVDIYRKLLQIVETSLISDINEIPRAPEDSRELEEDEIPSNDNNFQNISYLNTGELRREIIKIMKDFQGNKEKYKKNLLKLKFHWEFLIEFSNLIDSDNMELREAIAETINNYLESRNLMVNSNLKLVYSIAKNYVHSGIPLLDLIQEGTIGLMKAVDRFDFKMGYKFSTFATWWVRQAVTRSISNDKYLIRLPVHIHESINKVHKVEEYLILKNGNPGNIPEIAEFLGWNQDRVSKVLEAKKEVLPLYEMIDNDKGINQYLIDSCEDNNPEYSCILRSLHDIELDIMKGMKERDREIILYRFGFYDGKVYTLETLGEMYGVTRERIRQIEEKALKKIRNPKYTRVLKYYLYSSSSSLETKNQNKRVTGEFIKRNFKNSRVEKNWHVAN